MRRSIGSKPSSQSENNNRKTVSRKVIIGKNTDRPQRRRFPQVTSLHHIKNRIFSILHEYEEGEENSSEIIKCLRQELTREFEAVSEKLKEQQITVDSYKKLVSERKKARFELLLGLKERLRISTSIANLEKKYNEEENQRKEKELLHNYLNSFETFFNDLSNEFSSAPNSKEFEIGDNFEDTLLSISETQNQLNHLRTLNSSLASFIDSL